MSGVERPATVGGWPVKDLVLIGVASVVAGAVLLVVTDSAVVAATGAFVGGLWFLLGCIYGYGEAVGI